MIFIGWAVMGLGVLLMYCAYRNLSPTCVVTNTLQGKSSDCKNK